MFEVLLDTVEQTSDFFEYLSRLVHGHSASRPLLSRGYRLLRMYRAWLLRALASMHTDFQTDSRR